MAGKSTFSAHSEQLALSPDVKLKFRRRDCTTCGKETIHRGWQCAHCGGMSKILTPNGDVARMEEKKSLAFYSARTQRRQKAVLNAKQEYWRKQAEESRKKFEGGK